MEKYDFDCLGFGICPLDYLSILKPYPNLDEKVDIISSSIQGGGPVPTAMATLSRLGARTAFVGKVGDDYEGGLICSEFEKFKVNTDYMIIDKRTKSLKAFIWVDKQSGKRTVALDQTKTKAIKPEELSLLDKIRFKYLHLDGRDMEANIFLAGRAKKIGTEIILDVGSLRDNIDGLLPYIDYLIVSKKFVYHYIGSEDLIKACQELKRIGFKCVVITLSEKGCLWVASDKVNYFPGFKVGAVDTTGAGDVFHGAFIFGLLKKWKMEKIIEFASACAALKCKKLGGREGIPTLKEVESFLKEQSTALHSE